MYKSNLFLSFNKYQANTQHLINNEVKSQLQFSFYVSVVVFLILFFFLSHTSQAQEKKQCEQIIKFSGYEWTMKQRDEPAGPGPNYFSGDGESVFIDSQARLHLKIRKIGERWVCSQVNSLKSFGYGKYIFHIDTNISTLDKNAVLGLFTYCNSPEYNYREIDVEFSRWNKERNLNSQFVVQPGEKNENKFRFDTEKKYNSIIASFDWKEERIDFLCLGEINVDGEVLEELIESWSYRGKDIPKSGGETCRINLWLFRGTPPEGEMEVIIKKFRFIPATH